MGTHAACIGRLGRWGSPAVHFNLASQTKMAFMIALDAPLDEALDVALGLKEGGRYWSPPT